MIEDILAEDILRNTRTHRTLFIYVCVLKSANKIGQYNRIN